MRKLFQTLIYFLAIFILTASSVFAAIIPVQQDSLFTITVGNVELQVDADFGAKVSSLKINGEEFLVNERASMYGLKVFWGSTVWPAPETDNGWPPVLTLDNSACVGSIKDSIMTFVGQEGVDVKNNSLQIIKSFWASEIDTSINIRYSLVNKGRKEIQKGLWELTRVGPEGIMFYKKGENEPWGKGSRDLSYKAQEVDDYIWMEYSDTISVEEKKFFDNSGEGWLAFATDNDKILIKTFRDVSPEDVVTGDDEVQYYLALDHFFVEVENQSRYANIAPGDTFHYDVRWYLRSLPDSVDIEVGNKPLINFTKTITDAQEWAPEDGVSSIVNETFSSNLKVFPNPASSSLYIELPNAHVSEIKIYNVSGRQVLSTLFTNGVELDVSNLNPGMYFYNIESEGKLYREKLIIQ